MKNKETNICIHSNYPASYGTYGWICGGCMKEIACFNEGKDLSNDFIFNEYLDGIIGRPNPCCPRWPHNTPIENRVYSSEKGRKCLQK